jgi:hypothetical protein
MNEYDKLSNYAQRLVVPDKMGNVEDSIIKSCECATSKSSLDSLDFYDVVREAFHGNPEIQYYFNHDIRNINPEYKKTWQLRYHVWEQYEF